MPFNPETVWGHSESLIDFNTRMAALAHLLTCSCICSSSSEKVGQPNLV